MVAFKFKNAGFGVILQSLEGDCSLRKQISPIMLSYVP